MKIHADISMSAEDLAKCEVRTDGESLWIRSDIGIEGINIWVEGDKAAFAAAWNTLGRVITEKVYGPEVEQDEIPN